MAIDKSIRPLPKKVGIGFTSMEPLDKDGAEGYQYQQMGHFHNYHFTPENMRWPEPPAKPMLAVKIDAFSPNLNKQLHIGHLRNLAIGRSLCRILPAQPVALLGASLGVRAKAVHDFSRWTDFLDYRPEVFYDVALPTDLVGTREGHEFESDDEGRLPQVWDGPDGPVIAIRSDGRRLYSYYDLAFAKWVCPNYYLTGHEQKGHFKSLALDRKHLPMGLVLGEDGKKLKSREGNALSADDAFAMVKANLNEGDSKDEIAWNVLAYNFLSPSREKDLKFKVKEWTSPQSGGMYVTYTYARIDSALTRAGVRGITDTMIGILNPSDPSLAALCLALQGTASYYNYYFALSQKRLDPAPLAEFALEISKVLNDAYHKQKITGGQLEYIYAVRYAASMLKRAMQKLGMFVLRRC